MAKKQFHTFNIKSGRSRQLRNGRKNAAWLVRQTFGRVVTGTLTGDGRFETPNGTYYIALTGDVVGMLYVKE